MSYGNWGKLLNFSEVRCIIYEAFFQMIAWIEEIMHVCKEPRT